MASKTKPSSDEKAASRNATKHAGGRPPKFETPEEMQIAVDAYFDECDTHPIVAQYYTRDKDGKQKLETEKRMSAPIPYTMTGLAIALGFESRRSLVDYRKKDRFSPTIKAAKMRIEQNLEERMIGSNGVVAGIIFNAKNNFDFHDKQEIDHTTKGKSMQPQVVSEIAPRTTQDVTTQTEAAPSNTADQQPAD